ncbi:MAG: hypothetical protein HKM07_01165 [Chlamydiae bacterium]|nr:hypothetical protein [Chlamydiota bacterium]
MKKWMHLSKLLFLLLPELVFAFPDSEPEPIQGPWLTGTLLSPGGYTIPQGHVNFEPYLFINSSIGKYDGEWKAKRIDTFISTSVQLPVFVGITSFMDFQMFPQASYNHVSNQNSGGFSDLPLALNFQVWSEHPGSWAPAVRVGIMEIFPTGKYNKRNPEKLGTDITGEGAYTTAFNVVFAKTMELGGTHFMRTRLGLSYAIPSSVHVEGFNTYGGGFGTKGKVLPGNQFSAVLGIEYTPTLHWAFALDIQMITSERDKFSGKRGATTQVVSSVDNSSPQQLAVSIGDRSLERVSLAPAVEYNFSQNVGMIVGMWFTVAGRNTTQFVNGVAAVNIYF